jgi:hypothetical protein
LERLMADGIGDHKKAFLIVPVTLTTIGHGPAALQRNVLFAPSHEPTDITTCIALTRGRARWSIALSVASR